MEKTRIGLILMALALVFSVGSVEAQEPDMCLAEGGEQFPWNEIVNPNRCDKDRDCYVKNNNRCIRNNSGDPSGNPLPAEIDCDDSVFDLDNDCGDPEPDPEPTTGTPVIVTFDDFILDEINDTIIPDSIQSDGASYEHDGLKTGVSAILNGLFTMILRAGGDRKLFINFGPAVDCGVGGSDLNCVVDDSNAPVAVECPFPTGLRTQQDGTSQSDSCSALVKANLTEHDVFDSAVVIPDPDHDVVHVEDMDPGDPVIKVRPFQEWDIEFQVPRSKGNKSDGWRITFSDKQGNCPDGDVPPVPEGHSFPDFLSIRALDVVDEGALGADTWKIGTFQLVDENDPALGAENDPRLACLLKSKTGGPLPSSQAFSS